MKCINSNCNNLFNGTIPKYCDQCGQLQINNENLLYTSIGDKNIISTTSTTINNNNIEDDTKKIIVCAVSGKRIFLKDSIKCKSCNQDVSTEFYIQEKTSCKNCYDKCLAIYKSQVEFVLVDQIIDPEERIYLNQKAKELNIDSKTQINIESEVKKKIINNNYGNELIGLHKIEFDIAKRELFIKQDISNAKIKLKKIYETNNSNESVANLYYLSSSIHNSEEYLTDLQKATVDIFWQHYWSFLAFIFVNENENSFEKLNHIRTLYSSRTNEIKIAEAVLYLKSFLLYKEIDFYNESKYKIAEIEISQDNLLRNLYSSTKYIIDNYDILEKSFNFEENQMSEIDDFNFYKNHLYNIDNTFQSINQKVNSNSSLIKFIDLNKVEHIIDFKENSLFDLSKFDNTKYITVGRKERVNDSLYFQINDHYLSRIHCKLRLLTPIIFEIIDLGSTNGTIVNEIKLFPNVSYFFQIDNLIILGNSTKIEIETLYEKLGIIIKKREIGPANISISSNFSQNAQLLNKMSLKNISKEYFELPNSFEFNQINDNSFSIVNKIFGFNNSMMFKYYFSINKGIEIIFINNIQFDYNKTIDPELTYNKMFKEMHVCKYCKSFIDFQIINNANCLKCDPKRK